MSAAADLLRLVNGFRTAQAIYVAADLGLSDLLAEGPRSSADLASAAGCDPRALHRLLRALATVGVYEELPDGRFASTALGDELRSGASLAGWVRFACAPASWQAWGALGHSVRTGENAFTAVHGEGVWEYRARRPRENADFDAAMRAMTRHVADAVLVAYDFGRFATVVDVGGGNGAMLAAVLARHPQTHGVLVDQPHVVAGAPAVLAEADVADRCEVVGGDMFAEVPAGGDAYLLKSIIHDWPDDRAIDVLRVVRRAMAPDATVILAERVMPPPPYDARATSIAMSDLNMLVAPGGQERTAAEFEALLDAGGLRWTRIVPTASDLSLVEARPAG